MASEGGRDKDLKGLDVIWSQFSTSKRHATCCFRFGHRRVFIRKGALVNENDNSYWNLYLINHHSGKKDDHYFYKFVLIPPRKPYFGKKRCMDEHSWDFIGSVHVDSNDEENSPLKELYDLLRPYHDGDEKYDGEGIEKFHVHVGIAMESLTAYGH
jgi:hypothetical protein